MAEAFKPGDRVTVTDKGLCGFSITTSATVVRVSRRGHPVILRDGTKRPVECHESLLRREGGHG